MRTNVQNHIKYHTEQVLLNWTSGNTFGANLRVEETIVYQHLKILVRWYAQISEQGADSYDQKKNPLEFMITYGTTKSAYNLIKMISKNLNNTLKLYEIISDEYKLAKLDKQLPSALEILNSKKTIKLKDFNLLIRPLLHYEHMTPCDVIVQELIKTNDIAKIEASDYYIVLIKTSQRNILNSKGYKKIGRAKERLRCLQDQKATKKQLDEIKKILKGFT